MIKPFVYQTVRILMLNGTEDEIRHSEERLSELLGGLLSSNYGDPIIKWALTEEPVAVSGEEAEDMFEQPDLIYPGRQGDGGPPYDAATATGMYDPEGCI